MAVDLEPIPATLGREDETPWMRHPKSLLYTQTLSHIWANYCSQRTVRRLMSDQGPWSRDPVRYIVWTAAEEISTCKATAEQKMSFGRLPALRRCAMMSSQTSSQYHSRLRFMLDAIDCDFSFYKSQNKLTSLSSIKQAINSVWRSRSGLYFFVFLLAMTAREAGLRQTFLSLPCNPLFPSEVEVRRMKKKTSYLVLLYSW